MLRKLMPVLALCTAACGTTPGSTSPPASAPQLPATMTIAEVTPATVIIGGPFPAGQSVTVSASFAFNSLRFSWLDRSGATVPLTGTMQIYTREYLGVPKDMGPSTPGFLAQSVRVEGNAYVFDDSVTLNPGAKYWFLEDGSIHSGAAVFTTQPHPDYYPGGDFYIAGDGRATNGLVLRYVKLFTNTDGDSTYDANFRLTGHPFFP